MRQPHDDKVDKRDCPSEESGGVGPVRHRKMPLLQPPQHDKKSQKSETDDSTPKSQPLNCWTY